MILITGATGQLGKSVVEQLTKRIAANQIVAFVRDESKASVIKEKGVNLAVGNYDDVSSLDQVMRGVEKVLLISGTEQNRIQQHQNVVDAAKRGGAVDRLHQLGGQGAGYCQQPTDGRSLRYRSIYQKQWPQLCLAA